MQASPTPKVQRDETGAAAFECGTTGCGETYQARKKKTATGSVTLTADSYERLFSREYGCSNKTEQNGL